MSNYAESIARPPRTLTEREVALLLRTTGQHAAGWRDHVIFGLALGTGLREHEILALDIGDVFDGDGSARRHVVLRVFKRATEDPAPQEIVLSDTLRAKLEKLLKQKRADGQGIAPADPLFISRKHRRLSTRQLRHAFAVWQKRAGFERHFSFHSLRHSACSNLYRRTRDIRLTQRFARHCSITTTGIYTHPTDEELVRSVQELPC
ncbi:MAG: tyrosine-type recombinase/integrase [Deltaproteobacteria bacterium]|nr:tyrosine-type recombinase/integrase [Deltaproteobacteria bacterium]